MKRIPLAIVALMLALSVAMAFWITPVVGLKNSACNQDPYYSGCR